MKKGGVRLRVWLDTPFTGSLAQNWLAERKSTFVQDTTKLWSDCLQDWTCIYIPRKSDAKLGDKYWFPPGVNGKPLRSSNDVLVFLFWVTTEGGSLETIVVNHAKYDYRTSKDRLALQAGGVVPP